MSLTHDQRLDAVVAKLRELIAAREYVNVEIHMEAGSIVRIKTITSRRIEELDTARL